MGIQWGVSMIKNSVFVESLELTNFLPLLASTGLDKIKIDWSKAPHPLTIILGVNGSGKTFLESEITPAPNEVVAGRNRGFVKIIPGKDGQKKINLLLNKRFRYHCTIDYPDKGATKCYLFKEDVIDGSMVDLNPNGNVSSYMDMLEVELGFTPSYINIGYISDGVTSLIEMSQQERNTYLSRWLPSIMEFLDGHKNAQKNRNTVKRQLDMLNQDIARIVVGDFVQELNNISASIASMETELEEVQHNITKGEVFISQLRSVDIKDLRQSVSVRRRNFDVITSERTEAENFLKHASDYAGDEGKKRLEAEINQILQKRKVLESQLTENDRRITEMRFHIQEKESRSKTLYDGEELSLIDILEALKAFDNERELFQKTQDMYLESYSTFDSMEVSGIELNTLLSSFEEIKRIWGRIQTLVDSELLRTGGMTSKAESIERRLAFTKTEKAQLEKENQEIANRIYILKNNGIDANILQYKRDSCTPDNCPLVREILTYLKPSVEIVKIEQILQKKMEELRKAEENILVETEDLIKIRNSFELLEDINHILYRNREIIAKLPGELSSKINVEPQSFVSEIHIIENLLKGLEEFISVKEKLSLIDSKIATLKKTETIIRIKEDTNKELQRDIRNYQEANEAHISINDAIRVCDSQLENYRGIAERSENFALKVGSLNAQIVQHNQELREAQIDNIHWYYRSHLKDIIYNLREKRAYIKRCIESSRVQKETIQSRIATKEMLEKKRTELVLSHKTYDLLEKIWSPRSGYPALLIKDFLEDVKDRTNKDLAAIWGESIQIKEFILNDSEFSIPIIRNGEYLIPDAILCSDGERVTLALAISLAILQIHVEKNAYNVLRLDEADAKLDDQRRRMFLDVVMERMEEIGCVSCMAITHNNEFNNTKANLIIMSPLEMDPAVLQNKHILFAV